MRLLSSGEAGLLFVGPFLILVALLMLGVYPGEKLLLRVASTPRRRRQRAPRRRRMPRSSRLAAPRGGALLAASLAGRAPPA